MVCARGKFVEWNLTMGQYDAVAIAEVPDDAAAAAVILGAGKEGFIRTTTLKAFSEAEAAKILESYLNKCIYPYTP